MAAAYGSADGLLEDRLLASLSAGLAAGGDLRGQQAAALTVVSARPGSRPLVEFRVDDHPQPIDELRRLVALDRADRALREALGVIMGAPGDPRAAAQQLADAQRVFGTGNLEPSFWRAVVLERLDGLDVYPDTPAWRTFRERLRSLWG